eukprot:scaffold2937_cov137-Skeletonema_menzelii.AAC.8
MRGGRLLPMARDPAQPCYCCTCWGESRALSTSTLNDLPYSCNTRITFALCSIHELLCYTGILNADVSCRADAPALRSVVGSLRFEFQQAMDAMDTATASSIVGNKKQVQRRDAFYWLCIKNRIKGANYPMSAFPYLLHVVTWMQFSPREDWLVRQRKLGHRWIDRFRRG